MLDETDMRGYPTRLYAGLVAARGSFVLVMGAQARWRYDPGCVFIPLELPGGAFAETTTPAAAIAAIGRRWLGQPLRLLAAESTYGPSREHAIDRLPAHPPPAPLLSLQRLAPADPAHDLEIARVTLEVFRATRAQNTSADTPSHALDTLTPQAECAGLLLLSWQALRAVVRGLPLADLLTRPDVTLRLRPGMQTPSEALVYLTGEYGERTLLRIAAKYGAQALGKDLDDGTEL